MTALQQRTVAIIGYGNQGRAHALNMRDSGVRVIVGSRDGNGATAARRDGFDVRSMSGAAEAADLHIIALPDQVQPTVLAETIMPALREGCTIGFLHGLTVRYGLLPDVRPDVGIVMVAPKGPGTTLRERYLRGQGIPCLLAVHRESSRNDSRSLALAWANALGCARAGVLETTFADETETDLFGEQAVLCGGMTRLILTAFEMLVEAGYPPELAYIECCHEVKQVADLVHERGLAGMMRAISDTAEYGAYAAMQTLDDQTIRARFRVLLDRVRSGEFARDFRADHVKGGLHLHSMRTTLANHPIEQTGQSVRRLMPWLSPLETESADAVDERP